MRTINEATILLKKVDGEARKQSKKSEFIHLFEKNNRFDLINNK